MEQKRKKILGAAIIAISILFMAAVCLFLGGPLVKFAKEPENFRKLVDSFGIWGYFIFVFIIFFQVVFAFIPGEPFEIFAGYAFGAFLGTLLCIIGSCLGSAVVFLFTRKWGVKFVELFFSTEKINSVKFLRNKNKTYLLTFLAFFIPGTPKDLLSYVAGLTHINFWGYMLLSSVARIPSVLTSAISGSAFGTQNYAFGIIAFGITGIISAIGIAIYGKLSKKHTVNLAKYIGKTANVQITRCKDENNYLNYGTVNGIWSSEGDIQDAYICGITVPLRYFSGKIAGYITNTQSGCESLIVIPKHTEINKEQILSELALCGEFSVVFKTE